MMTTDEFFGLPTRINGKQCPFEIHDPMNGYFSIARFYGGIEYNGVHYVWDQRGSHDPHDAVLVRQDLFRARAKAGTQSRRDRRRAKAGKQSKLL